MRKALAVSIFLALAGAAEAASLEDLQAAQENYLSVWQELGLAATNILLVEAPSKGYGAYVERSSSVYKPGEPIVTYLEPVGYGWKEKPDGGYDIAFVADLTLKSEAGEVLIEKPAFFTNVVHTMRQNTEFSLDFTVNLSGVPAGKYTLFYTLHDQSSGQAVDFEQQVEIAE